MKKSMREYYAETYGEDEFEDGTVLRFYKKFDRPSTLYTYVTVKTNELWYVSGSKDALTWYSLLEFFEQDNTLGPEAIFWTDFECWEQLYEVEEDDE